MNITVLLLALLYICVVCVIFKVILVLTKPAEPMGTIAWAICTLICLFILINAVTGNTLLVLHR